MLETTTRAGVFVDALNARFATEFAGSRVRIVDGPPLDVTNLPTDVLSVGYPGPDGPSVEVDVERQDGLGNRLRELITVRCVFSTYAGDKQMKARRDRCLWALGLIDGALKADRGIGGVVDRSTLGPSLHFEQIQFAEGVTCEVYFSIVAQALI